MNDNLKNQKKEKIFLTENNKNILFLYFISTYVIFLSDKNSEIMMPIIVFSFFCYSIYKVFYSKNTENSEHLPYFFLSLMLVPLLSVTMFFIIEKTFQKKELKFKEEIKFGVEYIVDQSRKNTYKIYIDSTKEIKKIENELDFYELKFNNCQILKVTTKYYDYGSVFYNEKYLSTRNKQETYLKDKIIEEIYTCVE